MSKTSTKPKSTTNKKITADQYNDPSHNYLQYWDGRDYEHAAEEIAIRRLIGNKTFKSAADIGGGYGRLCVLLRKFSDKVTLAEPSQQQLDIAKDFLKNYPEVKRVLTQAEDLKLKDKSQELLTVIRVMHHLPNPAPSFKEFARVMTDDGYMILEVANYAHGRNRLKYLLKGKKLPAEPVDIRSEANKKKGEIPFVNHNPKTVQKQLAHAGLKVEKVLSVSNLRSPGLKKIAPKGVMLVAERILQPTLARTYFGPSVFFLVRKAK
jgi:ubiquinone/menaquinone biosynthesis C-methylase UbiE